MRLLNTVYVLDHQARVRIDKGNLRIEQPSGCCECRSKRLTPSC